MNWIKNFYQSSKTALGISAEPCETLNTEADARAKEGDASCTDTLYAFAEFAAVAFFWNVFRRTRSEYEDALKVLTKVLEEKDEEKTVIEPSFEVKVEPGIESAQINLHYTPRPEKLAITVTVPKEDDLRLPLVSLHDVGGSFQLRLHPPQGMSAPDEENLFAAGFRWLVDGSSYADDRGSEYQPNVLPLATIPKRARISLMIRKESSSFLRNPRRDQAIMATMRVVTLLSARSNFTRYSRRPVFIQNQEEILKRRFSGCSSGWISGGKKRLMDWRPCEKIDP